MRRVFMSMMMILFVVSLATVAYGSDKVVGSITEVVEKDGKVLAIKLADEKQGGKVVEVKCEKECKVAKGTTLKAGEKVTVQQKGDTVSVRKAVAGC